MSIPYTGTVEDILRRDIERKTGIKIEDIKIRNGYWMALLMSSREIDGELWIRVTDLLQKPNFTIKTELLADTGVSSLYLV